MRISDFGRFDGPVLLMGGPGSNLQALGAFDAEAAGKPVISTGDIAAYGADPEACVALVRARGWPVVAGNCERQIADGAADCGCGFGANSVCDALSRGWYPYALAACGSETRGWMQGLPDLGVFIADWRRYGVVHGGATAVNRYLWPSSAESDFTGEIAAVEDALGRVDGIVAGHLGIAFHRRIGRHHWINAGTIGLPPHDGRPETRYAILANGEISFARLSYDHDAARAAMEAAGLTLGYHATLTTGIWPSEEILPPEFRR